MVGSRSVSARRDTARSLADSEHQPVIAECTTSDAVVDQLGFTSSTALSAHRPDILAFYTTSSTNRWSARTSRIQIFDNGTGNAPGRGYRSTRRPMDRHMAG